MNDDEREKQTLTTTDVGVLSWDAGHGVTVSQSLAAPDAPLLSLHNDAGVMLVSIARNGDVTFGPGMDPKIAATEAARIFWAAIKDTRRKT